MHQQLQANVRNHCATSPTLKTTTSSALNYLASGKQLLGLPTENTYGLKKEKQVCCNGFPEAFDSHLLLLLPTINRCWDRKLPVGPPTGYRH